MYGIPVVPVLKVGALAWLGVVFIMGVVTTVVLAAGVTALNTLDPGIVLINVLVPIDVAVDVLVSDVIVSVPVSGNVVLDTDVNELNVLNVADDVMLRVLVPADVVEADVTLELFDVVSPNVFDWAVLDSDVLNSDIILTVDGVVCGIFVGDDCDDDCDGKLPDTSSVLFEVLDAGDEPEVLDSDELL